MLATTLSELEPKLAAASLAAAVLSIGGPGLPREKDEILSVSERLIEDAISDLNITDKASDESADRLRRYLSDHVDSFLMKGFDKSEIFKRLGNRGDLPRGAYSITLGPAVVSKQKVSFVEGCIRDADAEQHLMPEGDENAHKLSIFLKEIRNNSGRRSIILVCATRSGNTLLVDNLFQMIPRLFDLSEAKSPLDYLRTFVSRYPCPIRVGESQVSKSFWENEVVPIKEGKLQIHIDHGQLASGKQPQWASTVYGKMLPDLEFLVIVGFGVNDTVYRAELATG